MATAKIKLRVKYRWWVRPALCCAPVIQVSIAALGAPGVAERIGLAMAEVIAQRGLMFEVDP